jgi:NTE family protein
VNASGVAMRFLHDRLDGPWFPRTGSRLLVAGSAALTSMGASQSYQRAEARWTGAFSTGPHTVSARLQGGNDFGSDLPPYGAFLLGGPFRLSGYPINRFSGTDYYLGTLQYYNRLLRLPSIIGSGLYVGASAEIGRMYGVYTQLGAATGTLYSGSVYLGSETFLGPVYLGLGYGGGSNFSLYLLLGAQ